MYFTTVLGFVVLRLHLSVSYSDHLDFQKVGEVIFNNEKFNVLKPTTHTITDYFKEFMLRQTNTDFPTKRIFIDDNGLRHAWTGFGEKKQSLRKTDNVNDNENEDSATESDVEVTGDENVSDDNQQGNNTTENNDSTRENTDDPETVENEEMKTSNNDSLSTEESTTTEYIPVIEVRNKKDTPQKKATESKERTVAQTTFYCPFFGVVTMSTFID